MKPRRLVREWKRVTTELLARVPALLRACRGRAGVDPVHDLRVVLRRLRLLLRVGRPLLGAAPVDGFIGWSRVTCDAAGPLRDDDVALEWLARQDGAAASVQEISGHRQKATPAFRRRLRPRPRALGLALARVADDRASREQLQKRIVKRIALLRRVLRQGAPRFFRLSVDDQHEFRRRLRQWRYLREFDLLLGREAGDPSLKELTRLQEAIGEFQNLKIVEEKLPALRVPASRPLRLALRKDQARWHARIQKRLRAAVNRRRPR